MRKSLAIMLIPTLAFAGWFLHTEAQTPQPIAPPAGIDAKSAKPRDGGKLPEQAEPIFFSAHRALEWLKLANKPDGRFVYGFQPSLRVQLDGDNFQSQAGATLALARAARYFRDGRGSAIARQAALTLLELETLVDPKEPAIRTTAAPPTMVERLSAHGLLISAIHELADADKTTDLLDKADQLCNYLKEQQKPNGMLFVTVGSDVLESGSADVDADRAGWRCRGSSAANGIARRRGSWTWCAAPVPPTSPPGSKTRACRSSTAKRRRMRRRMPRPRMRRSRRRFSR